MDRKVESPDVLTEIPPELKEFQAKYLGETLASLITQDVPKGAIRTRPGRGGSYPYVPVYWFVPQMNALFGYLWDIVVDDKGIVEENVEVEEDIIPEGASPAEVGKLRIQHKLEKVKSTIKIPTQVWVQGHLNIKIPGKAIIVREFNGDGSVKCEVETRYDAITITKHAFGGVDIKYYTGGENAGMMMDLADDYKSAEADMGKKAGSYLGMMPNVYGKRELLQETGPSEGQLKALYKRADTKGLDKTQTAELSRKLFDGSEPEDLDSGQFVKFMQHLLIRKPAGAPVGVSASG